jgi:hypothetical protein
MSMKKKAGACAVSVNTQNGIYFTGFHVYIDNNPDTNGAFTTGVFRFCTVKPAAGAPCLIDNDKRRLV